MPRRLGWALLILTLALILALLTLLLEREKLRGGEVAAKAVACYYLTDVQLSKLAGRKFKVLVVEFEGLNRESVEELKRHGEVVLGYVNFGYAEEWRSYWPRVRGEEWIHGATGYTGEFFVEYWDPRWHKVVLEEVEKACEMGFNGVFFDNIDACVVVGEEGLEWAAGLNLTELMVDSIARVSELAREECGAGFKVYVNIGSALELLTDSRFLSSIDGVLREEAWYTVGDGRSIRVAEDETALVIEYLTRARHAGKVVVVADFLDSKELAEEFCSKCWEHGFIPVPQPVWASDYSRPPPPEWCDP